MASPFITMYPKSTYRQVTLSGWMRSPALFDILKTMPVNDGHLKLRIVDISNPQAMSLGLDDFPNRTEFVRHAMANGNSFRIRTIQLQGDDHPTVWIEYR